MTRARRNTPDALNPQTRTATWRALARHHRRHGRRTRHRRDDPRGWSLPLAPRPARGSRPPSSPRPVIHPDAREDRGESLRRRGLREDGRGRRGAVRGGDRHRDPRPAQLQDQGVLPVRRGVRRRAQHALLPHLHGLPGHVPRPLRGGGPQGGAARPRSQRQSPPPVQVRPQAVLLPGPSEGLPDLPVRRAHRGGRLHRRRHPRRGRRRR